MADKHIIDGVDVAECEYFGTTLYPMKNCTMDSEYFHACKGCNCYYKQLVRKKQECERLKWYLEEIRNEELKALDIEWDEYETQYIDTEYSNIITLVEEALEEIIPEDCRYGK